MIARDSRQGFLGPNARDRLDAHRVGVVGCGGGGSHVIQQLAHVLVPQLTVFDPQCVEETNLNRLVAAREDDIGKPKLDVAARVISGLVPMDQIRLIPKVWQHAENELRLCDVVIGCVDSAQQRRELEAVCRRWLIPYVDIGLGIWPSDQPHEDTLVAGQVALSVPGAHCLECFGIVSEAEIAKDLANYGDRAPMPQVVWSNGVLASIAVGWVVELITGWKKNPSPHRFLRYDSSGSVTPASELRFILPPTCPHYPLDEIGPIQIVPFVPRSRP